MKHAFIFLAAALLPAPAFGQSLHQTADGTRLEIAMPCAKEISVVADPSLSGRVVLDAAATHAEELAQMAFAGGTAIALKLHGTPGSADCWRPQPGGDFRPTLQVKLSVPPGFPLAVDASGGGMYRLAAGGTLSLSLSGSPRIEATVLTRLDLAMSGSGDVKVTRVDGPIHAEMSGSGEVAVLQATAPDVALRQSGSSVFRIGGGSVGTLSVDSSGSGQVIVHGTVGNAAVSASGSGEVTIAQLTGRLAQSMSGSGAVHVERQGKE